MRLKVFPARAGMSRAARRDHLSNGSFPRPRGDEPPLILADIKIVKFSPPARG